MRRLLSWLVLIVAGPFVWAAEKPNVVLIFCDDMGYADIGPFGA